MILSFAQSFSIAGIILLSIYEYLFSVGKDLEPTTPDLTSARIRCEIEQPWPSKDLRKKKRETSREKKYSSGWFHGRFFFSNSSILSNAIFVLIESFTRGLKGLDRDMPKENGQKITEILSEYRPVKPPAVFLNPRKVFGLGNHRFPWFPRLYKKAVRVSWNLAIRLLDETSF